MDELTKENNIYNNSFSSNNSTPTSFINICEDTNNINIENIEEEDNLINYTENHFVNKIHKDLLEIRRNNFNTSAISIMTNENIRSNSPLTISHNGSLSNRGSDTDEYENISEEDESITNNKIYNQALNKNYKKLTYQEVESSINKYYNISTSNKYSNELDILNTFIKGQKNLYIQSKYITQHKLNLLMFPTLLISLFVTIVSPFIEYEYWNTGFMSGLNALIMFLISMINYLKLESSIEIYIYNAKNYEKLEIQIEMTSNKLIFLEKEKDKRKFILNQIEEVEKKMYELKEYTNVLIPEEIKRLFSVICHINIFSFIKKIELFKRNLIVKLKDVKNEIRYILFKWKREPEDYVNDNDYMKEKNRLKFLYEIKNSLKEEIFEFTSAYSHIDTLFSKEIKLAEAKKNMVGLCFICFFKPKISFSDYRISNPIIDKYFQFIFADEL